MQQQMFLLSLARKDNKGLFVKKKKNLSGLNHLWKNGLGYAS